MVGGVALALQHVRGDVTWPGAPDGLIPAGATDTTWLPLVGSTGLVVRNQGQAHPNSPPWNARRCALLAPMPGSR